MLGGVAILATFVAVVGEEVDLNVGGCDGHCVAGLEDIVRTEIAESMIVDEWVVAAGQPVRVGQGCRQRKGRHQQGRAGQQAHE